MAIHSIDKSTAQNSAFFDSCELIKAMIYIFFICFTRILCYVNEQIHKAPPLPLSYPTHPHGLNLGIYSIQDGRGFSLPQLTQVVMLRKYDVMLLTETKILDRLYGKNCLGYEFL